MRQSHQAGIALVIVVLISAIALMTFLFASSTLTIASRTAAASERNSTQALLAADSGLNTLRARTTTQAYDSTSFKNWIESNFGTLDLGDGITAQLTVIAETSDRITVQSVGTAGSSQRTVVQEFPIVVGPPIEGSVTVPGALTSVGRIRSNSNAVLVSGRENREEDWSYDNVPLCNAREGEYFVRLGITYRVDSPSNCSGDMEVVRVDNGIAEVMVGSTIGTHRPIAITEPLTVTGSPPTSVVSVTPGARSLFGLGSPITIGGNSMGTVTAVDGDILTIEWTTAPASQPEGAVVRRSVASGATAGTCDVRSNTFPNGCDSNRDMSNLFYKTFGISSPSLLRDSLPASHRISGSQVRDGRTLSGITWVTNPENNFRGQRGSGIIIIENNPGQEITLNVNNQFIGLIYIIGDANIQGNAEYRGSIVVDGQAEVQTSVQGTPLLTYDPLELMRAIDDIRFPNPNPGGIGVAISNTWRVR